LRHPKEAAYVEDRGLIHATQPLVDQVKKQIPMARETAHGAGCSTYRGRSMPCA